MSAAAILKRLRAAGYELSCCAAGVLVKPAGKLSDDDRAQVLAHKPELLRLLAVEAWPQLERAITLVGLFRGWAPQARQALLDDARAETPQMQADLLEHFRCELVSYEVRGVQMARQEARRC